MVQHVEPPLRLGRAFVFQHLAQIFTQRLYAARLEDLLLYAADQALSPNSAATSDSAYDEAVQAAVTLKVDLRQMLEGERTAEAKRWFDMLNQDPFFAEVQNWLPRRLRAALPQNG